MKGNTEKSYLKKAKKKQKKTGGVFWLPLPPKYLINWFIALPPTQNRVNIKVVYRWTVLVWEWIKNTIIVSVNCFHPFNFKQVLMLNLHFSISLVEELLELRSMEKELLEDYTTINRRKEFMWISPFNSAIKQEYPRMLKLFLEVK